jgi:hypothetical protein
VANQQAMECRTGAVIHGIKWSPKTAYIKKTINSPVLTHKLASSTGLNG